MDPEKRRKDCREAMRRHRAKKAAAVITESSVITPPPSGPVEIRTAEDLRSILAEQINLARTAREGDTLTRARLIGYLVGQGLRVLETGEIEKRLEELERKVNETSETGSNRLGIVPDRAA